MESQNQSSHEIVPRPADTTESVGGAPLPGPPVRPGLEQQRTHYPPSPPPTSAEAAVADLPTTGKANGGGFQRDEQRWASHLDDVAEFLRRHGRFPRRTAFSDPAERGLVYWIARQRLDLRDHVLASDRVEELDRRLPGWRQPGGQRKTTPPP